MSKSHNWWEDKVNKNVAIKILDLCICFHYLTKERAALSFSQRPFEKFSELILFST